MMKKTLDWNVYLETAADAVAEGIVMLKNEGAALPLPQGEQIALFGRIQLHYYKSGTGSGGMVNVSKIVGIPEGLRAFAVFPLGYPAESRKQQDRFDESRIHFI